MAVKPVVKVSYGRDALTLEEGKDYKLVGVGAYTEPTTTKKYTVSVEGINGYTGTTSSVNWGIDKKILLTVILQPLRILKVLYLLL